MCFVLRNANTQKINVPRNVIVQMKISKKPSGMCKKTPLLILLIKKVLLTAIKALWRNVLGRTEGLFVNLLFSYYSNDK